MNHHLNHELSSRWGVISNLHGFMMRHLDTGFKTKWSGYWSPPHKFLDYYAIKVSGIWLDSESLEAVDYGEEIVYYHRAGGLEVEEHVSTPDGTPGLEIKLVIKNKESQKKAVKTLIEPGVDIRSKSVDVPENDYSVERGSNRLTVCRDDKKVMISGSEEMDLTGEEHIKEHFPGERQECFIPGHIAFRKEIQPESQNSMQISFTTSGAEFDQIETHEQEFENQKMGRLFEENLGSMENLVYGKKNRGVIAGHPWFQNYWSRDTFWTLLGLIESGYFELSHQILENFARKDGFPKMDPLEERDAGKSADSAPLYVIAADKLERHWKTSKKIKEKQEEAMKHLNMENGVVKHDPEETWMDTLERPRAVDIQSLWIEAASIMDHSARKDLESGLREFEQSDYVNDTLEGPANTVNPAVPLMFGHFRDEKAYDYLKTLNAEFSSRYGARTRSMSDPGYEADGYHTGSVWGLTTGWAAAANFRYGKDTQGENFLEQMNQYLDRNQVGALPEVVNAETGELIGCGEQAWSAGIFNHVIDRYMLGINVMNSHVEIDPSSVAKGVRRNKRVGNEHLDLEFTGNDVNVLNSPDVELIIW